MTPPWYLGIDIGGTKIAAGMVTPEGRIFRRAERPTPAAKGGAAVLAAAVALAIEMISEYPDGPMGIGIGAGGQIDANRGIVLSATDLLPGWAGINIKEAFVPLVKGSTEAEVVGLPENVRFVTPPTKARVAVDNDVNALAIGEWRFGIATGKATVAFLALGTGVGGALLLGGRLHRGAHWSGAEFGHLLLSHDSDARRDTGGHIGTLEAYASGPGLVQNYREIAGAGISPLEEGPAEVAMTGPRIAEEALRDPTGHAAAAVARTGEYLGYGLVSLANVLDPDIIVVGGGLSALGDRLLDPARRILRERALPGAAACPVVTPALGADASVIGAASLAMPVKGVRN